MAWITPTVADVRASFRAEEITAWSLGAATPDPLAASLAQAVGDVRGYVRARNQLGIAGTIPDELQRACIILARHYKISDLRGKITDERKAEYDGAVKRLLDVANGNFKIDVPATPTTEITSAPAPMIGGHSRNFSKRSQNGIL